MSKEIRMFGKGKVVNGRIMFITEDGKGFVRPVTKRESATPVQPTRVIREEVDVPSFMKERKPVKAAQRTSQVIYVNFGQPASPKPLERFFNSLFGGAQ